MLKMPHLEINCIPSQLNTSKVTGVASHLAQVAESQPNFDNVTIEQMRGNPLYEHRGDDIDKIGLAQKQLIDHANIVKSKASLIRAYNETARRVAKPTTKN